MRKLLVSLLSIMMVVALATPVFATGEGEGTSEDPATTLEQLNAALERGATEIYVSNEIEIGSLTLNRGVSIKAANNTAKLVGSIVLSAGNEANYTFEGLTFDGKNSTSYLIMLEANSSTQVGTVNINKCTFTNAEGAVMFATDKGQSVNSLSVTESNLKDLTFNAIYVEDLSSVSVNGSNFTNCSKGILPFTHEDNKVGNISITDNDFKDTNVAVKFEVKKGALVDENTKIEITNNIGDGKGTIDYVVDDTVSSKLTEKVEISGNKMPLKGVPVASVDDKTYDSLDEALKEAASGKTVKLLSDVEVDEMINITGADYEDNLTLDLNGHKITASNSFTSGKHLICITGKTVTITSTGTQGKLVSTEDVKHIILADSHAKVTVENIEFDHTNSMPGAPIIASESDVTLSGDVLFTLGANSWYAVNIDPRTNPKVDNTATSASLTLAADANVTMTAQRRVPFAQIDGMSENGTRLGNRSAKVTFNQGAKINTNGNPIVMELDINGNEYHNVKDLVEGAEYVGVIDGSGALVPPPTPTPNPDTERPTYRPSSPSKDLPSNTKECQKEFGDEYIWSDEYDACVIKFMIVDTSTK